MKVILLNGSPHKEGCTYTALKEVEAGLVKNGIETELVSIGNQPVTGCMACGACRETHRCILKNDPVNEVLDRMEEAEGLVVGSPVYYASPNGSLVSFLDRLFQAGNSFSYKVGASVVSARRAGTTASLDVLNKYFTISNMLVVPSMYWNMVHGSLAKDVREDEEGLQTMRTLAGNMAWILKSIEAGKKAGIQQPQPEKKIMTNFIR